MFFPDNNGYNFLAGIFYNTQGHITIHWSNGQQIFKKKKKVNKTTGRLQLSFNKCNPSTAFPVKIWAEKLQHKLG